MNKRCISTSIPPPQQKPKQNKKKRRVALHRAPKILGVGRPRPRQSSPPLPQAGCRGWEAAEPSLGMILLQARANWVRGWSGSRSRALKPTTCRGPNKRNGIVGCFKAKLSHHGRVIIVLPRSIAPEAWAASCSAAVQSWRLAK